MNNNKSYVEQRNDKNILTLRKMRHNLPTFCSEFFIGIENNTSSLTRIAYAQDLIIFFNFLHNEILEFSEKDVPLFTLDDLNNVTSTHIEMFLDYLSYYVINDKVYKNNDKAKARKLASIRRLFKYFYKKNKIDANVSEKIDTPKIHAKNIIKLDSDEVEKLFNVVDNSENAVSHQQLTYLQHTKTRDIAILTLFLGTGIRISELVGINRNDINFEDNSFSIIRKGGNQYILYFSDEVKSALLDYKKIRDEIKPAVEQDNDAFFLSLQNKRITTRAVQNLVKKYSRVASPLKKISPHKLRSTYGTNLYQQTRDIYIVADVLGHKDVNTTKKHYAAISEDIRRNASTRIKLRKN